MQHEDFIEFLSILRRGLLMVVNWIDARLKREGRHPAPHSDADPGGDDMTPR